MRKIYLIISIFVIIMSGIFAGQVFAATVKKTPTTKIVNCGKNDECFDNAILACSPAQITYSSNLTTSTIKGVKASLTVQRKIIGSKNGKCQYGTKIIKNSVVFDDKILKQDLNTRRSNLIAYKKELKKLFDYSGTEGVCEYKIEDLKFWIGKKDVHLKLGLELAASLTNCNGSYYTRLSENLDKILTIATENVLTHTVTNKVDAARIIDLNKISAALALYNASKDTFPVVKGVLGEGNFQCLASTGFTKAGCSTKSAYLNKIPKDPGGGKYLYTGSKYTYSIDVVLSTIVNGKRKTIKVIPGYSFYKLRDELSPQPKKTQPPTSTEQSKISKDFFDLFTLYSKDKEHVYYSQEIVPHADPLSFEVLENQMSYGKDRSNIYYKTNAIVGADLGSFKVLGRGYGKDKSNIYFYDKIMSVADVNTFELLTDPSDLSLVSYSKDKNQVYFTDPIDGYSVLKTADPTSFKALGAGYGKDKSQVFFNKTVISNSDPSSFTILSGKYSKDINQVYYANAYSADVAVVKNADPRSFTILSCGFAKDKNYVYQYDKVFNGADAATMECINNYEQFSGKDKNHVWKFGRLVQ